MPTLPIRRRVAWSLVTAGVALALLEGVARLLPARLVLPRDRVIHDIAPDLMLRVDNVELGWDLDPEGASEWRTTYRTNRWGMRGPDYPEEAPPGARRIIFVGDSSVFGVTLEWEHTFAAVFARLREEREPAVDVQEAICACPGHSTVQSLRKLTGQCLAFRPDVVVIANQYSDSTLAMMPDAQRFQVTRTRALARALERLFVFRLARNAWMRRTTRVADPETIAQVGDGHQVGVRRVPVEEYRENLRAMAEAAEGAGALPVFLVLAARDDLARGDGTHSEGRRDYDDYRDAMRAVAAERGLALVDAPATFRTLGEADGLFVDAVHPGPFGAWLIGQLLDRDVPE